MVSNDLFYLFWGIICPLLPEVIATSVFTRWHFLASALLIISYVIKHLCEGTSDLKLEEVTWYEYKSNKFSHILGPKRTKKYSKRELRHYLILKIWGKQHIRNKGDQLSHSILINGDDASQLQLFRKVCPQGFVNLFLFTLTLFPGSNLQETTDVWEDRLFKLSTKGKKQFKSKCSVHTKIGYFRSVNTVRCRERIEIKGTLGRCSDLHLRRTKWVNPTSVIHLLSTSKSKLEQSYITGLKN